MTRLAALLTLLASSLATQNIAELVITDSRFSRLTAALAANNLVSIFNASSPRYTVFAPTDAVFPSDFSTLPAATQTAILTYHVLPFAVGDALSTASYYTFNTVNGAPVQLGLVGSPVTIYANMENVTEAIDAVNGDIHVISSGSVLMPPTSSVAQIAIGSGVTDTLASLVTAANLLNTLNSTGNYTVFAPTDQAFTNLEAAVPGVTAYLSGNATALTEVLLYHVLGVPRISAAIVADTAPLTSLAGIVIPVDRTGGLTIGGAGVVAGSTDLFATNGIVHVIDAVMVPAGFQCGTCSSAATQTGTPSGMTPTATPTMPNSNAMTSNAMTTPSPTPNDSSTASLLAVF